MAQSVGKQLWARKWLRWFGLVEDKRERRKASNRFNGLDSRLGGILHCDRAEQPVQMLTHQIGPITWWVQIHLGL